jgi:hypothetical protein
VYGLRVAAQVDLISGKLSPYLIAGGGGVLYAFGDQATNAGGTLVGGGGVAYHTGGRTTLFAEGTGELYRSRTVTFSYSGNAVFSDERTTNWNRSLLLGFAVEF